MEYHTFEEISNFFNNKDSKQAKVFNLLKDKQWHCRECEGTPLGIGQYAGGGGIQGLERGTKSRSGLVIEERISPCKTCQKQTKQDRLTGEVKTSNATSGMPTKLIKRVLEAYDYTDIVEERRRAKHELVIDHRFPMERWGENEESNNNISEKEIVQKFQLLKKDEGGNHNLLKSRSCERCIKTGKRGYPFGIKYWYKGDENWSTKIPTIGKESEQGCVGCGWYDMKAWRESLNHWLKMNKV